MAIWGWGEGWKFDCSSAAAQGHTLTENSLDSAFLWKLKFDQSENPFLYACEI